MLDELEKLAREASGCAFTACGCRDCKAWAYAMNPATGLLLLAAVRAAEAYADHTERFAVVSDDEEIHAKLRAALDALKGST